VLHIFFVAYSQVTAYYKFTYYS